MNTIRYRALVFLLGVLPAICWADRNIYQEELKALKRVPPYNVMFDKESSTILRNIIRDIENRKETISFQHRLLFMLLREDIVIVTPKTMPKLHGYISSLCKKHNLATPVVCITKDKGLFNAMAAKLFTGSGGIIIGQDVLNQATDEEIEAVVAHEIGHIYHNHSNKALAIRMGAIMGSLATLKVMWLDHYMQPLNDRYESFVTDLAQTSDEEKKKEIEEDFEKWKFEQFMPHALGSHLLMYGATLASSWIVFALLVGKRYEQQADIFAYAQEGKGRGLIRFFKRLQQKDQKEKDAIDITADYLDGTLDTFPFSERLTIRLRFFLAKLGYQLTSASQWLSHNTPFGAHPSDEQRIKTVSSYLESSAG